MRRTPDGDLPVTLTPEAISCRTALSPWGFYFKSADTSDVYLYDEVIERCIRVFHRPSLPFNQFTVSPDGRWLASDSSSKNGSALMITEHFG